MRKNFVFISESVSQGHPDKLCDQISDAIVDHHLRQDPRARVRAECSVFNGIVFIAARFHSSASVDIAQVARKVIARVGYTGGDFDAASASVLSSIQELPPDPRARFDETALSEDEFSRIPAMNQVTVFGFACRQSPTLMPLPLWLGQKITSRVTQLLADGQLPGLMPEARAQVGVQYQARQPVRIQSINLTTAQTASDAPDRQDLEAALRELVLDPVFEDETLAPDKDTRIFINPEGPELVGGPARHSGLTGRKNGLDTYGGYSRNGEKALSGKDPLRIDRSGAYAARQAAKSVVAAGLAEECEVQLTYSIGRARPVGLEVETFGTAPDPDKVDRLVEQLCDFRPAAILKRLNLRNLPRERPQGFFEPLARGCHMGRPDMELPWETLLPLE